MRAALTDLGVGDSAGPGGSLSAPMPSRLTALPLLALVLLAGCGGGGDGGEARRDGAPPVLGAPVESEDADAAQALGFPGFATKNTTRVGGADPVADAAGVARAVYPGFSRAQQPAAVVLVDIADWQAAISAAQLAAAPLRLPILFTDGAKMPDATAATLEALEPTGSDAAGDARVIRIGGAAAPAGVKSTDVKGADAPAIARAVDRLAGAATERPTRDVIVAPSDAPAFAMPAAGLAAHTGAPVLWTDRDKLPPETRKAITSRRKPRIFVLGPASAISDKVADQLEKLGPVRRIEGPDPVRTSVAAARFASGTFGWGVNDPGHGLVIASAERPADAAAAALLSSSGKFGPLLLISDAGALPSPVEAYLLDIQPGYERDPTRGVYNHAWIMGDEEAVEVAVQAKIDALLEIQPIETDSAPSS